MEKERKLICIDDLRKTKEHFVLVGARAGKMKVLLESMIEQMIKETPVVDAAEVVHGWWVNPYINRYGHPCHCCSVCGFKASYQDKNYCPNYGAKMDGDGNVGMA